MTPSHGSLLVVLPLVALLAACATNIADVNARPDKFYQERIHFSGRIVREQRLPDVTVFEVASRRGARILVRVVDPGDAGIGTWVRVEGILVPEARVGDAVLYDVVVADEVAPRDPPRLPEIM